MKIEQQRTHGSTFPVHYETFVNVHDRAGYKVGFTGKGWVPGMYGKTTRARMARCATSRSPTRWR